MNLKMTPIVLLLGLAACAQDDSLPRAEEPAGAAIYDAALAHPSRPAADLESDQGRKPAEVLAFFDIQPGMTVLDLFSGSGYYSEIISYVVGPAGRVVAHSNSAYRNFVGNALEERLGDSRLPNVEILMAENNELELPAETFDAVTLILTYHDIFHVDVENGWPKINGPKLLAEIYEGMKPGGVLGVVDHHAEAGSPRETGNSLHRIDPGIVISELEIAGFEFDGRSNVLRNMNDDYSKIIFDPEVRGRTDRFVFRFRKPE
jgi:predicted methyltransferase